MSHDKNQRREIDAALAEDEAAAREILEVYTTSFGVAREHVAPPHPIGTCFADSDDTGEEWTFCPFCGGQLAPSGPS
jgi:hypothetical protein